MWVEERESKSSTRHVVFGIHIMAHRRTSSTLTPTQKTLPPQHLPADTHTVQDNDSLGIFSLSNTLPLVSTFCQGVETLWGGGICI